MSWDIADNKGTNREYRILERGIQITGDFGHKVRGEQEK
jgi:hypothetical protein